LDRLVILLFAILIIAVSVKGVEIAYAELPFIAIVKPVDETVNNSDVHQNDDHLFFACSAGKVYFLEWNLIGQSVAEDFNTRWTLPTGATGEVTTGDFGSFTFIQMDDITANDFHPDGGSTPAFMMNKGIIEMGSTSGTCQFQWAQNNAGVSDTTIHAGSTLIVYETTPSTLTIPFTTVVKIIDEVITSTATPQNDDELFFACSANRVYSFELQVFADAPAVSAFATQWSLPTGATGRVSSGQHTSGAQMEPTQERSNLQLLKSVLDGVILFSTLKQIHLT